MPRKRGIIIPLVYKVFRWSLRFDVVQEAGGKIRFRSDGNFYVKNYARGNVNTHRSLSKVSVNLVDHEAIVYEMMNMDIRGKLLSSQKTCSFTLSTVGIHSSYMKISDVCKGRSQRIV